VGGANTKGLVRCMLPAGHEGQHVEHLRWDEVTPVELAESYDPDEPFDTDVADALPADFEATPPCPECAAGKHRNCGGDSWNNDLDEPKPCPCWLSDPAGHLAVVAPLAFHVGEGAVASPPVLVIPPTVEPGTFAGACDALQWIPGELVDVPGVIIPRGRCVLLAGHDGPHTWEL
jgi:hypothetical protein